jgi:hypothetical protein
VQQFEDRSEWPVSQTFSCEVSIYISRPSALISSRSSLISATLAKLLRGSSMEFSMSQEAQEQRAGEVA